MTVLPKRHILKTITYRLLSTISGFVILWIATGNIRISASFSAIELIFKPYLYYIHERIYYKYVKFGLKDEKK